MSNDRCDCYECISRREPRDAATHVDGREAPSQAAVDDLVRAHADRGSKVNVHDIVPRETGGREAPMEACEMPASSGGAAWAATVEACARAAYEASLAAPKRGAHGQAIMELEWSSLGPIRQGHWRDVARAVLAAAARGGK